MRIKKVVLAYSGGLDTTVMIKWLKENYKCKVIAFCADLGGQDANMRVIKQRALKSGADKIYIKDLKKEFAEKYILSALKANCIYESKYYLATAIGRPIITAHLIDIANKEKADAIAHGSTGKGNDQVRFEVSAMILNPKIEVLAPVREWELKTREEEIEYAKKHKLPISASKSKPYSYDVNLWGVSIECGVLEDLKNFPPEDIYLWTVSALKAKAKPEKVSIEFKKGVPVKLNNKKMGLVKIIENLNKIAGRNGIGRSDLVENRLVGIKSREVYEAPAAEVLTKAHKELEAVCLDRETQHFKIKLEQTYAELVYNGLWFTPLKQALDAFMDKTQEKLDGEIVLELYKGNIKILSRYSPNSLYRIELATYEQGDKFNQSYGKGFVQIWGLPYKYTKVKK